MKRLWAPWRMKFVDSQGTGSGCVFCQVQAQTSDAENLIVFRGRHGFVILNRYPYTSGHLMVVTNAHLPTLEALDAETRLEMMELATQGMGILRTVYRPDGFNFGANIGAAAGAGIAGHVHLHVVPRWGGDTNFMSALADTRILPEELGETYRRVFAAWNKF
ncbi:MAG: HIT domain-containing protein [Anaerolineales bacterium]